MLSLHPRCSWDAAHLLAPCCHHHFPAYTAAVRDLSGSLTRFLLLNTWRQRLPRRHAPGLLRGVARMGEKTIQGVNQTLANPSWRQEAGCSGTNANQLELTGVVFWPAPRLGQLKVANPSVAKAKAPKRKQRRW